MRVQRVLSVSWYLLQVQEISDQKIVNSVFQGINTVLEGLVYLDHSGCRDLGSFCLEWTVKKEVIFSRGRIGRNSLLHLERENWKHFIIKLIVFIVFSQSCLIKKNKSVGIQVELFQLYDGLPHPPCVFWRVAVQCQKSSVKDFSSKGCLCFRSLGQVTEWTL